jgi:hypothetical protein
VPDPVGLSVLVQGRVAVEWLHHDTFTEGELWCTRPAWWCGVVWCGVVWCGVVWCGVVWCGVVWCGVTECTVSTKLMTECMVSTQLVEGL